MRKVYKMSVKCALPQSYYFTVINTRHYFYARFY